MKEPKLDDLRPGLRIDKNDLDNEIGMQADTYFRVAEACALAASRRDEAKSLMDEEQSRAGARARANAAAKDEKATEAQVKEQANKDRKFLEARDAYLQAKSAADLWVAMREAYDMRGKMLREMAQLQIAGYYQVQAVGGKTRRDVEEITRDTNRRLMRSAGKA